MKKYFFDTSAFVKYYHVENGTAKVSSILAEAGRFVSISTLGVLETQSVFAMKVRMTGSDPSLAEALRSRLMLVSAGTIEVFEITGSHFRMAELLIGRYSFTRRLRTLDALQLAVAIDLAAQNVIDYFVVSDRILCEVAALEDLNVLNPEVE